MEVNRTTCYAISAAKGNHVTVMLKGTLLKIEEKSLKNYERFIQKEGMTLKLVPSEDTIQEKLKETVVYRT